MSSLETRSALYFQADLPPRDFFSEGAVLIFDRALRGKYQPWIKTFTNSVAVTAGEKSKSWGSAGKILGQINSRIGHFPKNKIQIVVLGGGSLGDLGGFIASIFKRGVSLHLVPSTWLSALDSAHGGKNALNLSRAKNQVGTFYFPKTIHLAENLLKAQPCRREQEAFGEVLKMALLDLSVKRALENSKDLWTLLPAIISAKLHIVSQDPFEKNGPRRHLNLGHTMGHVIEASLKVPHGIAVSQGLVFVTALSKKLGLLSTQKHREVLDFVGRKEFPNFLKVRLAKDTVRRLLLQDKKNDDVNLINFVLLEDFAKPKLQSTTFVQVEETLRDLKWLK